MYLAEREREREHGEKPSVRASPDKKQVRVRLNRLVGTVDPEHSEKDPVWSLTETFSTAFAQAGTEFSKNAVGKSNTPAVASMPNGAFLQSFGQIAFRRGDLAAAILRGQGEMMLVSCLKRAYSSASSDAQRTTLPGEGGRNVSLTGGGQVVFRAGELEGAVGLVTKSMHSARWQLAAFRRAALAEDVPDTLLKAYPFLSAVQEKEVQEQYKEQLRALESTHADPEELAVLRYGIDRLTAIVQKKEQQRQAFLTRLEELLRNIYAAEETFSDKDFIRRARAEIAQAPTDEKPPDAATAGFPADVGEIDPEPLSVDKQLDDTAMPEGLDSPETHKA